MKINKNELLEILIKLRPVAENKDSIKEQLNYFTFLDDYIFVYNSYLSISYPYKNNFNCSILADEFFNILKKIEDDKVEIITNENNKIKIKSKEVRANLINKDNEISPNFINKSDLTKIKSWSKLPEDFLEGLLICLFSIGNTGEPYLSCLNIKGNNIISSDGNRISRFNMKNKIKSSFLLFGESAKEIIKYKPKEYYLDSSWVYFKTKDNIIICSKLIDDDYPSVSEYFDIKGKKVILPNNIISAVDIASILAIGDFDIDKRIEIIIEDGEIICRGEKDIGWLEKRTVIKSKAKLKFFINPLFFSKILELSNYMEVTEEHALFKADNFEHLVCLPI